MLLPGFIHYLISQLVYSVQVGMNHFHQMNKRLALHLAHCIDTIIQAGTCACPEGFLQENITTQTNPVLYVTSKSAVQTFQTVKQRWQSFCREMYLIGRILIIEFEQDF